MFKLFENGNKGKEVIVLCGCCWEKDGLGNNKAMYQMEPMVFASRALAMKQIRKIMKDTEAEGAELEYGVKCEWKSEFNTLEIKFEDGTIEDWVLYEKVIQ